MIQPTANNKSSKTHLALSGAWAAIGCASARPKKAASKCRYFDWEAEGGYIPYRFQGAYRARWRREDRQAYFEESRARKVICEMEKTVEPVKRAKADVTNYHERIEKAIGTQGMVDSERKKQIGKAIDALFLGGTDRKLESLSVWGLSGTACVSPGNSQEDCMENMEGTLAELQDNRNWRSRSVLGLSGATLVV